MTLGGDATRGHKHSEESKRKMSESLKKAIAEGRLPIVNKKKVFAYDLESKEIKEFDSYTECNNYYAGNNVTCTISHSIRNNYTYHNHLLANSIEELQEKIKNFKGKSLHAIIPDYEHYFEYLKSISDENGIVTKTLKEIGEIFNRKSSTLCGWNKKLNGKVIKVRIKGIDKLKINE